jgi:hypothetical protein
MSREVVVVYHDPCLDGMASRYAAWKKFGNDASYIPGKYEGKLPLDRFKDKRVYCVDFSYKKDAILQILTVCKSLHIYDHHKTAVPEVRAAQAELEGTDSPGQPSSRINLCLEFYGISRTGIFGFSIFRTLKKYVATWPPSTSTLRSGCMPLNRSVLKLFWQEAFLSIKRNCAILPR